MRAEAHNRDVSFPQSFGGDGVTPLKPRVTIVGGGLTGILAAFQAHRMGVQDIELYERLDQLGGVARPELRDGREIREGCIYFGPKGDPMRSLLEEHGAMFEDFDNCFGSVSPAADGLAITKDFGGPALQASSIDLSPLRGESLADRLACYDQELTGPLRQYVQWHVGRDASELHASAAVPLAINRVYPANAKLETLAQAKRTDELANELFGIPRSLWGYTSNTQASLPAGGFTQLFSHCHAALSSIGVRIHERSLATPKKMLSKENSGDILVWAASPIPLYKAVGLDVPKAPARKFATYTFEARWTGPVPFYVQNFTTEGSCFRVYIYESAGSLLLTAECVERVDEEDLTSQITQLLDGFDGKLTIGDLIFRTVKPRWLYHSVDTIDSLGALRSSLKAHKGENFIAGAWEAYGKDDKFAEVEAGLLKALEIYQTVEAV
ncbi:MAG: NAD(P)-binding protein [Pseudomonadota bacterium]